MADRDNVPYAGEVQPTSDTDDDETAYSTSTFQRSQFNTTAYTSDSEDEYDRFCAGRNERDPFCHMPDFDGGENEDCDYSDISENVLKSSENGNKNDGLCDCIEHLGLSEDDVYDTTKTDDEKDAISEDENPEEVEREDTEENDDTTEERNNFGRFLELSNLFFRNIMRKAYDFSKRTPRE